MGSRRSEGFQRLQVVETQTEESDDVRKEERSDGNDGVSGWTGGWKDGWRHGRESGGWQYHEDTGWKSSGGKKSGSVGL